MRKLFTVAAFMVASATSYVANAQRVEGDLKVGDKVTIDGKEWYVGSNLITNPSFSENPADNNNQIVGWTIADAYKPMYTTDGGGNFLWFAEGGRDGGAYIQANKHGGSSDAGSIGQRWSIEPGKRYFFSFWLAKNSENNQYIPVVSLTDLESEKGGQHEDTANGGRMILGKNGDSSEDCLGFANYNNGEWCQTGVSFESEEYTYLQFNARWLKENSIQACFDDFYLAELFDPDETQPEDIAALEYVGVLTTTATWADNNLAEYNGLYDEISDWMMEHEYPEGTTVDEIQAEKLVASQKLETMKEALNNVAAYEQLLEKASNLLNTTVYAGIDEFNAAISDIYTPYQEDGYVPEGDVLASEYIVTMVANLEKTINDYLFSQNYSEDEPADYSFMISNPSFDAQGPWYVGTTPDGAQQQIMTVDGTVCWQSWCNKQDYGSLELYQDLSSLPNGYYTVSVNMTTQGGCITDQHAVAISSLATANSPVLTDESIDVSGAASAATGVTWETLKTDKVAVVDGKLKIGAIGHCSDEIVAARNDYRAGSFWVTDFKLQYYGPLSDEDALAAYNAKVAEVQAQADTMHFAADKAAYQAVISENSGVTTVEGLADALAAIAEAQTVAMASEKKYAEAVASTTSLQDSVQNAYGEKVGQIVKMAVDLATADINAADATYTTMDAMITKLRYYRDSYVPAFTNAETMELTDAIAKAAMEGTLADEVNVLTKIDTIPGTAILDEHIAFINNAIKVCKTSEIIAAGGTDYTVFITNAAIDDTNATGWTLRRENSDGNGAKSGQAYDGSNGFYIDSHNPTAGKLLYTAYQTIENIPNGVYELKAMNRVSGTPGAEGVYMYAIADNDTVNAVFKAMHQEQINITKYGGPQNAEGGDSIAYVSDSYGSIFAKAWDDTNGGGDVEEGTVEEGILEANNGRGRGWFYNSFQIEVKNHVLTIGVTNDSVFTKGHKDTDDNDCVPFSGWWFSCDNFTLTQVSAGDNTGWNPATGIEGVEDGEDADIVVRVENGTIVSNGVIYSISGARVANGSKVPAGVYVVRLGNTAKKVFVK